MSFPATTGILMPGDFEIFHRVFLYRVGGLVHAVERTPRAVRRLLSSSITDQNACQIIAGTSLSCVMEMVD